MIKTIIIGIVATFCFLFLFSKIDPKINNDHNGITSIVEEDYITTSISGEVNKAGTYIMKKNASLGDLIDSAGGLTSNADIKSFNESISLKDGINYYIAPLMSSPEYCEVNAINKVNINTASKEELIAINGIGTTVASAIISYREDNGPFTYLEQIMEVPGIGNATYEKIKNYITIN